MNDLTKLPVTVVTGFLGSGKTTLIRHLMQNPGGKRLAIIVNEFGDVGVDGEILKSCAIPNCPEENILELANGCICCTVADDFIPTLERLMKLEPRPEHILIETSGLALPKPLLKAFDWPDIRSKITVDGVIALADAEAVAAGQFAPDLAGAEGIAKAKAVIAAEAPRSLPVIEVADGHIDPRVVLGLEAAAEDDLHARPSHHDGVPEHDHEDFDSVVIGLDELESPESLIKRIEILAERQNILRVKGYAAVKGKPMRLLVQAVGARVRAQYDRPWAPDEMRMGRVVVIAEHDHIDRNAIESTLKG